MKTRNAHSDLFIIVGLSFAAACGGEEGDVEVANAGFSLASAEDCMQAFETRPFLVRVSEERGWGPQDIAAFCTEVDAVAETYANSSTLSIMTVAGVGQIDEETLQSAYYVGVAGYELSAVRDWLSQVRASRAVRPCTGQAASVRRESGSRSPGFLRDCLETETGLAYPEPLFRQTRSQSNLDDVGALAAGLGLSLAIYHRPDGSTVVGFLAGSFYAQAEPIYGAFFGCGAIAGFDAVAEQGDFGYVCLAAEY